MIKRHKLFWIRWPLVLSALVGVLLLTISLFITYYANIYATTRASNFVTDIILDNIPTVNVNFIFNEGAVIFVAILALITIHKPHRVSFVLKSVAMFLIVRSIFIILTHLAPPHQQSYIDPSDIIARLSSGGDLFFSAHTGLPFLFAIAFWHNKFFRSLFLAFTVIGGTSVLLGHLHYSIDVFSALFIAFGIFHMARVTFQKDYSLFLKEEVAI